MHRKSESRDKFLSYFSISSNREARLLQESTDYSHGQYLSGHRHTASRLSWLSVGTPASAVPSHLRVFTSCNDAHCLPSLPCLCQGSGTQRLPSNLSATLSGLNCACPSCTIPSVLKSQVPIPSETLGLVLK